MIVGLRVPPEQRAELGRLVGILPGLRERHVHVVVEDDDEPGLAREVQDPVEGGIDEAGRLARDLRGDELLVDRELADPGEHAGKVCSTRLMWSAAYMSAGLKPVIIGSKRPARPW
jgi:hypothetical protein